MKFKRLTLVALYLRTVKLRHCCSLRLDIIHGESVEKLIIYDSMDNIEVQKLEKLKQLYCGSHFSIDPIVLSYLKQLKEI